MTSIRQPTAADGLLAALDIKPASLVIIAGISLIAGAVEDQMTPFGSVLYMIVLLFIYHASVSSGPVQGLFVGSGFFTLVVMGSMFRPAEDHAAFRAELPLDFFLFFSLAFLPGFIVNLYSQGLEDLRAELAEIQTRIRVLKSKVHEDSQQRRSSRRPETDKMDLRRGNSIAELVRNGMGADSLGALIQVLGRAMSNGMDPRRLVLLLPGGDGGAFRMHGISPEEGTTASVSAPSGPLAKAAESGRVITLERAEDLGDGLELDLLAPISHGGRVVAVVGVLMSRDSRADHETKYASTMIKITTSLIPRVG